MSTPDSMHVVAKKCRKSWCVNCGNSKFSQAVCKHLRALLMEIILSAGLCLFPVFIRNKWSRKFFVMGIVRGADSVFVPGRKIVLRSKLTSDQYNGLFSFASPLP